MIPKADLGKKQPEHAQSMLPNPDQANLNIPVAPFLINELFGGQDVNDDGRIYGRHFMFMENGKIPQMLLDLQTTNPSWPNPAPSFEVDWDDFVYWTTKVARIPGVIGYLGSTRISPANPCIEEAIQLDIGEETPIYETDSYGVKIAYRAKRISETKVRYFEFFDVDNADGSISRKDLYTVDYVCQYKVKKRRRMPWEPDSTT